ncbi:MAG: hypothetical protein QF619_03545 [Candidatus Binatia bacterium]|jgi:hypothetical protein|nr:hypothetical protein [Candidatus Binatia bacterium]
MEVIEDSWEWMAGGKGWRRYLEQYPAKIAFTHRHHPVTVLLRQDPAWVYIYSDPVSFVFVKESMAQNQLLNKFNARKLLPPGSSPAYSP